MLMPDLILQLRQLEAEVSRLRTELAQRQHLAADVLEDASRRIERRRTTRRMRWLHQRRWSARDESVWSQGMWDASGIVARYARDLRRSAGRCPFPGCITRPGHQGGHVVSTTHWSRP